MTERVGFVRQGSTLVEEGEGGAVLDRVLGKEGLFRRQFDGVAVDRRVDGDAVARRRIDGLAGAHALRREIERSGEIDVVRLPGKRRQAHVHARFGYLLNPAALIVLAAQSE